MYDHVRLSCRDHDGLPVHRVALNPTPSSRIFAGTPLREKRTMAHPCRARAMRFCRQSRRKLPKPKPYVLSSSSLIRIVLISLKPLSMNLRFPAVHSKSCSTSSSSVTPRVQSRRFRLARGNIPTAMSPLKT